MKVDCSYCRSESVIEMTDSAARQLIEQLSKPIVLTRVISELCKSLNIHPPIKAVLNITLVVAVEYVIATNEAVSLDKKPYRCEDCHNVFTVFNQSV